MKKKTLAIVLVVCLLATALVSGTLAYFKDTQSATNVFTVGNVKIWLLESYLHRQDGTAYDANITPEQDVAGGEDGLRSDEAIIASAIDDPEDEDDIDEYHEYLAGKQLMPGIEYNKMPYVLNTGDSDAYIRIRVMIPTCLNTSFLNSSVICTTALEEEFKRPDSAENDYAVDSTKTVDGVEYDVYTFIRKEALPAYEMTKWNVWDTIRMDDTVTTEQLNALLAFEAGKLAIDKDGQFKVLVEADAIQAAGFADVDAAFAAFDAE